MFRSFNSAIRQLSTRDRCELILILLSTFAAWIFRIRFSETTSLASLCLFLAGVLLGQSLLRDLWIWTQLRRTPKMERPPQVVRQCMCVESLVGAAGVGVGLLLLVAGGGVSLRLQIPSSLRVGFFLAVLLAGFGLKDLVIDWSQRRILRERDHSNWLPRWR